MLGAVTEVLPLIAGAVTTVAACTPVLLYTPASCAKPDVFSVAVKVLVLLIELWCCANPLLLNVAVVMFTLLIKLLVMACPTTLKAVSYTHLTLPTILRV